MALQNSIDNITTPTKKSYLKKWLSYIEQYNLLLERGMQFNSYSKDKALKKLEFIGYYRLSGYFFAFRKEPSINEFIEGTQFKDIIELYKFDRKLKLLLLDAIERIEVALRASIAYQVTQRDVMFLNNDSNFTLGRKIANRNNRYKNKKNGKLQKDHTVGMLLNNLRKRINEKLNKRKSEPAIAHLLSEYKPPYPLWIVIQIFDFSDLCDLFQIIDLDLAKQICTKFGVKTPSVFTSWIQSIRAVRNICAHHSRLVNRNLSISPSIPNVRSDFPWINFWGTAELIDSTKIFSLICIIHHILNFIEASRKWDERLVLLMSEFPKINVQKYNSIEKVMGCPKEWKKIKEN